jgi:hypothetical protein
VIDPDDAPPPLQESPAGPREGPDDGRQRLVAVLIMIVSLVGGIFAFLQTTSSNQAARATRRADIAAAEAMARLATGAGRIAAENRIWSLAYEDALVAVSLAGAGGDEAAALSQAYYASRQALLPYTDLALPEYLKPDGSVDWSGFVEEALAPSYRSAEYQKAYAAERDGWGAKGGAFVAMVTVLAVALFLLGLSRTSVAANSGGLLVGVGTGLALLAAIWGLVVLIRPVASPSEAAIEAFVAGRVAFNSVAVESDATLLQEGLTRAEEAFGEAIAARPGYFDAYLGRGTARFRLDFASPEGPNGPPGSRRLRPGSRPQPPGRGGLG